MEKIEKVIMHITAGDDDTVESIREDHKANGWSDIGYHGVFYKDGSIHAGRIWTKQGAHCSAGGGNVNSLGISWVTRGDNFDSDGEYGKYLTPEQMKSAEGLLGYLLWLSATDRTIVEGLSFEFSLNDIFGHNEYDAGKACPCFKVSESGEFKEAINAEYQRLTAGGDPIDSVKAFIADKDTLAEAEGGVTIDSPGAKGDPEDFTKLPDEEINEENKEMHIDQAGIDLIKYFEGLELRAYRDAVDVVTIGYGTTRIGGRPVTMDMVISKEQAEEYLRKDCEEFEKWVSDLIDVPLNQNQFNALVSFTYNLGPGNLKSSTLRRKLNKGDYAGATAEFGKWVKAGGRLLEGLVKRRRAEKLMFTS